MTDLSEGNFVTLEISGKNIDPDTISRLLGVGATRSSADPEMLKLGSIEPFWVLDTRGEVKSTLLSEHLRWLADKVSARESELQQIASLGSVQLLANGRPQSWIRNSEVDEFQRSRIGVPFSFVVFVQTSHEVKLR